MMRSRMITRLAHRSFDWSSLQKKLSDPRTRGAVESLRQAHAEVEQDAKKYLQAPAPIDFDAYRKKIKTPGLVDAMEVGRNENNGMQMLIKCCNSEITKDCNLKTWMPADLCQRMIKKHKKW